MTNLPRGEVTFLFTDIEGSTQLWDQHPEAMRAVLAQHDDLLRECIENHNGQVFKTMGDAFCAVFLHPRDAIKAVLAAQQRLPDLAIEDIPLKVRMALHTGAAEGRDHDYFGAQVNRVARLLSAAHGGQTLVSRATADLLEDSLPVSTSLRDLGAHQLRDLSRPEHVFQLVHPNLEADFPPIKSLSTHRHNLPRQLTSFVGRERAMEELKGLLSKTHLLTLTGVGGTGKTRLCLQLAEDSLELFPDGVWFVELASLTDPGLVARTVADVLGVTEQPVRGIVDILIEQVRKHRLLLILDNCEHLLDACAKLTDSLARSCLHVKILATSREALGIAGELAYRVPSLSLPDPRLSHTPQSLAEFESVRLFIDRAQFARPDFRITQEDTRSMAQLCFQLDGIPLAIELAAARVRSMSVDEVSSRLGQRFRLLTGGSRTALPRQQTLRALIDWSYELLTEAEKTLLQRLSVFSGGWALAASEKVCSGGIIEDWEVLELLSSLTDKSLCVAENCEGLTRYRLLETVRQYARDRLLESGEGEEWRNRHLQHFLYLAEKAEPRLKGAEQQKWLERLELEHDNLRSALEWSREADDDGELGLRIVGALWRFWYTRGHLSEGRDWISGMLNNVINAHMTDARAKAYSGAAALAFQQGDYPVAIENFELALTHWRASGNQVGVGAVLCNLGNVHYAQGDLAAARSLYEQSLAIQRELDDKWATAGTLNNLGNVANNQGDLITARAMFEESLEIHRESGDRVTMAHSLGNLGTVAWKQGDYTAARSLCGESLGLYRELGDRRGIAYMLSELGRTALKQRDNVEARKCYTESLAIVRETGDKFGIAHVLNGLAALAASENRPELAVRIWGAAERIREEINSQLALDELQDCEGWIGEVRRELGDTGFSAAFIEGRGMLVDEVVED